MYLSRRINLAILGGALAVFALSLWLVRSQETVDDVSWMTAMIARLEAHPVPAGAPDLPSYRDLSTASPPPRQPDGIDTHKPIR